LTIKPVCKWYDLWVGVFVARPDGEYHDNWRVFVLPLPCVGVVFEFDGRVRRWCRDAWRASRVRRAIRPPCPTCDDTQYVWITDDVGRDGFTRAHAAPCPTCYVPYLRRVFGKAAE
jgi:hypothetical protein